MIVTHRIGPWETRKQVAEEPEIILANTKGSFLYWRERPSSRYHGFWVRTRKGLVRTFVRFQPFVSLPANRVVNSFSHFDVERAHGFSERFFLDPTEHAFAWEASSAVSLSVVVDVKAMFDNSEWERFYGVSEEDGMLIVEFAKGLGADPSLRLFLACMPDGNAAFQLKREWVNEQYDADAQRKDPPFSRWTFVPCSVTTKRLALAVSEDKEAAKRTALRLHSEFSGRVSGAQRDTHRFAASLQRPIKDREVQVAYLAAKYSLSRMVVHGEDGKPEGLYAGVPWLSQFWVRDFALSANALSSGTALAVFREHLAEYARTGTLDGCLGSLCMPYADTEGWFFLLGLGYFSAGALSVEEANELKRLVVAYLEKKLLPRMKGGFVWNGPKETWMDTEYRGSGRAGVRIEIQVLALQTFALAAALTGDRKFVREREALRRSVRTAFWDGRFLADGLGDGTMRPNAFLAYRIAPDLLFPHEWASAFASALDALWLPWGGLASLPASHPLFCGTDRGCDDPNRSYHHGNSWFFVNNLAAGAMAAVDTKRFRAFIDALLEASTDDILWSGAMGHHSEVSSADARFPGGCRAQSWSAATYCDTIDTLLGLTLR